MAPTLNFVLHKLSKNSQSNRKMDILNKNKFGLLYADQKIKKENRIIHRAQGKSAYGSKTKDEDMYLQRTLLDSRYRVTCKLKGPPPQWPLTIWPFTSEIFHFVHRQLP